MEQENAIDTAAAPVVPDEVKETDAVNAAVEEDAADSEKDTTQSKVTTDDTPAAEKDTTAASSGRAKRVRKSTTNYVPEEETKKEIVIPDGKGTKLEDMPNVVAKFKDVTWSTPSLKNLYSIVFGVGQKKNFKAHLLQFNGFVFPEGKEDAEKEKVQSKMYKLKMDQLKDVMDLCDIDRSLESFGKKNPDKDMLCTRFLEWLEEPKESGKKLKQKTAAKRKSSSTAKATKKSPAKKAKKEATKSKPKKKKEVTPAADSDDDVEVNIPGVSTDKIRAKIETIVASADRESVTVKDVRKKLEDWLDMDLAEYKNGIRALVMDVM